MCWLAEIPNTLLKMEYTFDPFALGLLLILRDLKHMS